MDKFIGRIKSENSGITYSIWWNPEERTVWRDTLFNAREMIGYNAKNELSAVDIAKTFLELQV
jgi:hypothetical protein